MNGPNLLKKATILVVDDTPDNLALMSNLLKGSYKVKIANDGEKALKIATSDAPPDLILLDVMMPGMDGYEVCRRLKSDARTTNIPVIFLTAKAEAEDETKGLELGAVDYIAKPISPPIVMARVKSHLALLEKNTELERARAVAENANLAKSHFLSGMSHELRSPLNAILGFAQLMDSDAEPPTPNQKNSISQILSAGWHLLTLINEILDLAKIESGEVPMLLEPVPLAEVLRECRGMVEPQAQQRGIRLVFPEADRVHFVMADRTRVKQVLLNLLSNAVKYNSGRGSVEVACAEGAPGHTRVSVRDTGAGLNPEQLTQLFQPFNRLGQDAGGEEGTGIGLVVAKRIVELMQGAIGVASQVGVGSVFWFELPAVAEPRVAMADDKPVALAPEDAARRKRLHTLLYIEDNAANLTLVERIVGRDANLRLLTAVNGKDGMAIARAAMPDVILMDINLPDISGFQAQKLLREDPLTAHIPVIAVSANAMAVDIDRSQSAGFFHYITKPLKLDEFVAALDVAIEFVEQNEGRRQ